MVLLFELSLVLTAAKIGGLGARAVRLPAVLGELMAGVVLGNLSLLGIGFLGEIRHDPSLATLAELGVILLMFEVGVESTVPDLMRVGRSALLVALVGVVAPFLLGFGTVRFFFSDFSLWVDVFLGATLCATSVGISARVLKDLGRVKTPEGRTILGAAVVDDVLGLVILAVVVALIGSSGSSGPAGAPAIWQKIATIVLKAFGFLVVGTLLGVVFSKGLYRWAAGLQVRGMLLTLSLTLCFAFAFLAHEFGLAPIVGAFSAGLILEPEHSRFFAHQEESLEHLLIPLSTLFVPIFFLHMGMQVDVAALFSLRAVVVGLVLSAAAVAGKMACAAGVLSPEENIDRWTVALGMVPRGEVGLIFAGLGAGLKVGGVPLLDATLYAAIIVMVFITTAITPPLLTRRLGRMEEARFDTR
ncbi:MAG: cation:proton antiporter [Deltaproteobacteria bacterium]|nr:cation:proton antiporter [Deltaproteobacteria bacterium]MBW2120876.1 cation:proton antiporter [Deltaproteobacteria bacterium]